MDTNMNALTRILGAVLLLATLNCHPAHAGSVTVPNTFTADTPAVASQVNGNFSAVKTAVDDNDSRIAALETTVASLQSLVQSQASTISSLQSELAAVQGNSVLDLDGKLGLGTDPATGQPTAIFSAVNVQVVNGTGNTTTINGLGNLIVGYNEVGNSQKFCSYGGYGDQTTCENRGEIWAADQRSGSHNLIVGRYNAYSQTGGLVAGEGNVINGGGASVSGGTSNVASGALASVCGGAGNVASGFFSSVTAGSGNSATGNYSSVSGGEFRSASGDFDWAAGSLYEYQ